MSDILKAAEEIEEKLKKVYLVGSRIGSGFSFIDNSRDVQFYYTPGIVENIKTTTKNYRKNIEKIANEVISKYDDLEVSFTYRLNNFSFYVSPKIDEIKCKEACGEKDNTTSDSIDDLVLSSNSDEIDKQRMQLTKAKEIIKEMLSILPKENIEGVYEITEEAEQFISEV